MKALKDMDPLIGFTAGIIIGVAYLHTNFASQKYVDQQFQEAIGHSDMNRKSAHEEFESVKGLLGEIKDVVKTIENRTWDLRPQTLPTVSPPSVVIQKKE